MANQADFKKKKSTLTDNLLEILRGTPGGQNGDQVIQSPEEVSPREILRRQQEQLRQIRHQEYLKEHLIFTRKHQEEQLQVKAILEELKNLADSVENLSTQVEIAIEQTPVDPGIYHLTFFEKLRQLIVFLKKKVDESATWLGVFNERAKKRSHYWTGVGKAGTKFMLSPDRQVATSVG